MAGCGIVSVKDRSSEATQPSAGLYKTFDRGDTWSQIGELYALGGTRQTIQYGDITFMKFDDSDPNTVYMGTNNGLFYSYARGTGWFRTLENKGVVNDIAIDQQNRCVIYAAVHNQVFKTTDCARSWELIHFSSLARQYFTAIRVSALDNSRIMLGTSDGTLLESTDAGFSWEVLSFLNTPITRFLNHPNIPGDFFIVTPSYGIQRTSDGLAFTSLLELPVHNNAGEPLRDSKDRVVQLQSLSGTKTYFDLKFDTSQTDGLIYANAYGIFRLINGEYWQEIEILNKPKQARIYSIAIDGSDGKTMYFGTDGAFYNSSNGGVDWTVKKFPAAGVPKHILLAPDNFQELYIGFTPRTK
ncbi:MAG: hypothetical protein AAB490_03755 [Patescibacteria group bacterium]